MALRTKLNPMGANGVKYYTLTVTTSPANATCVLTYDGVAHTAKTATVKEGTVVSYSVSYSGYTTQTGSWTITSNTTKSIILSALYTLTVNCSYSSTYIYILDANGNELASTYNTGTLSYSVTSGTVLKYYVHSTSTPYYSSTYSVTMNANHTATFTVSSGTSWIHGYTSWTQPTLSSNTSANNFKVSGSEYSTSYKCYKAFDGSTSTNWLAGTTMPNTITFDCLYNRYNSNSYRGICIKGIHIRNRTGYNTGYTAGTVYYSTDGFNWTSQNTFTNSTIAKNEEWDIFVTNYSDHIYPYWKIEFASYNKSSTYNPGASEITITATEDHAREVTSYYWNHSIT